MLRLLNLTDSEYFAARAVDVWKMSAAASDPRAAAAHANLANRYERLAAEFDPHRAPQLLPSDQISTDLGAEPSAS